MADPKKPKIVTILQTIHLVVFVASAGTIFLLHIFTKNFLDFLRMPAYVKAIDPWASIDWPGSLHFYHVILVFIFFLTLINALGLIYYSSRTWRIVSDLSSFLSFLIVLPASLFFIYTIASSGQLSAVNIQAGLFFFAITFFVFILDLVTWYVDEQSLLKIMKK